MFLHSWILFLGGETNKVMNASDKYYDDSVRVYWNSYREGCSRKETLGLRSKCWEECLAKSWRRSGRLMQKTEGSNHAGISEKQKESQMARRYSGRLWPDQGGWYFKGD